MLTIRPSQMEDLARSLQDISAKTLAGHLTEDFPDQAEALGSKRLLEMAQEGLNRAASYGFESRETATIYVYVMFSFGRDFDKNPAFPWAAAILAQPAGASQRAAQLCDAAAEYEDLGQGLMDRPVIE